MWLQRRYRRHMPIGINKWRPGSELRLRFVPVVFKFVPVKSILIQEFCSFARTLESCPLYVKVSSNAIIIVYFAIYLFLHIFDTRIMSLLKSNCSIKTISTIFLQLLYALFIDTVIESFYAIPYNLRLLLSGDIELNSGSLIENWVWCFQGNFKTGDFTCRSSQWWTKDDANPEGAALDEFIATNNLYQLINEPTNIHGESISCIDLIITDQYNTFVESGAHPSLDYHCQHQLVMVIEFVDPASPLDKRTMSDYAKGGI